jgi:hypothetical protein
MRNEVDNRTMKVLLAALEIEQQELAEHMGYQPFYVANVLNGFTKASPAFRRAFGETVATFILGSQEEVVETYPPEPLLRLIESRAASAVSKRDFYRDLGTSSQALKNRKVFDGLFVDRICCALGVHPSSVYGDDYAQEAS